MHRLLFITETHPPDRGGMAESCDRILRGLASSGVAIDLVHFDRRATRPSFQRTSSGSQLRWPLEADAAHTINCLWNRLQQAVDLDAVTHVVAFGGTLPLLAAPVFAAWIRRPLIAMLRGNELDAGLFDPRRRPILDDALRRSAAVCTVTTAQADKVAALHPGVAPRVVANGIDLELWQATDVDRIRGRAWRNEQVATDRRVLGFIGHLKAKKGVPFFIETLLRSRHANRFHLLLVGELDDALRAQLEREGALSVAPPTRRRDDDSCSAESSPPGRRRHTEPIAFTHVSALDRFDLLPYYTACDLIVLPSHYEGFPNVLIEAMALGIPLIASNTGGMADVLADDETAFLFEPGDEHGCRDAIARAAAASDDALLVMGSRAQHVARVRCDARDETRRYLDVLDAVRPMTLSLVEEEL